MEEGVKVKTDTENRSGPSLKRGVEMSECLAGEARVICTTIRTAGGDKCT